MKHEENPMFNQKKLVPTKLIRNADYRAKSKGLCIFIMSLNPMDLALDK